MLRLLLHWPMPQKPEWQREAEEAAMKIQVIAGLYPMPITSSETFGLESAFGVPSHACVCLVFRQAEACATCKRLQVKGEKLN